MSYKIKYHPGYKNNKLKLIERVGHTSKGRCEGLFECDCGNQVVKQIRNVVRGSTTHCGSHACKFNDQNIFNGIELLEPTGEIKHHKTIYTAKCHCGSIFEVKGTEVRQGRRKSCGCLQPANKRYKKGAKSTPDILTRQARAMKLWAGGLGL